jgi:hypothetical protein
MIGVNPSSTTCDTANCQMTRNSGIKSGDARLTSPIFIDGALYRRSFDGLLLRCPSSEEARFLIEQAHSSECGGHISGQANAVFPCPAI